MPTKDEFNIEPWDDGDKIITVNGKPIGMCLDKHSANTVLKWIHTAKKELLEAWNTRPRCDQCKHYGSGQCSILKYYDYSIGSVECITTEDDFYCAKFSRRED